MERKNALKLIGYVLTAIFVLNISLFAFRVIDWKLFWVVLILGAILVYVVLPRMKK